MPFTEEESMYINHNGMATNVANTLTSHYGNLSTSTERLSSGMRINSAADDAAGLAISELMRADIAALNQGVRQRQPGHGHRRAEGPLRHLQRLG